MLKIATPEERAANQHRLDEVIARVRRGEVRPLVVPRGVGDLRELKEVTMDINDTVEPTKQKYTKTMIEAWFEECEAGKTLQAVAEVNGIHPVYLSQLFKQHGLKRTHKVNGRSGKRKDNLPKLSAEYRAVSERVAKLLENPLNYVPVHSMGQPPKKRLCESLEVVTAAWEAYAEKPLEAVAEEFDVTPGTLLDWFANYSLLKLPEEPSKPPINDKLALQVQEANTPPILPVPPSGMDLPTLLALMNRMGGQVSVSGEISMNITVKF